MSIPFEPVQVNRIVEEIQERREVAIEDFHRRSADFVENVLWQPISYPLSPDLAGSWLEPTADSLAIVEATDVK